MVVMLTPFVLSFRSGRGEGGGKGVWSGRGRGEEKERKKETDTKRNNQIISFVTNE